MLYQTIDGLREALGGMRSGNDSLGFVPTMGALHEGHLSLIRMAAGECDHVVISIFVNPTQFGEGEDYEEYPRNLERDLERAAGAGASLVFAPAVSEMYPEGYSTFLEVEGEKAQVLCGRDRPGHFRGVTTVVSKLFNIIGPDRAYFGRKDAQQLSIIRTMARDLNMNIRIIEAPIVREKDGLAMSSRNTYLEKDQRIAATILYRCLTHATRRVQEGERMVAVLKPELVRCIEREPLASVDYVDFRKWDTLAALERIEDSTLLALAVHIGDIRLIDNTILYLDPDEKQG